MLSLESMYAIMSEEKKSEQDKVTISGDVLRKYFPSSWTPKQIQDTILNMIKRWSIEQKRAHER